MRLLTNLVQRIDWTFLAAACLAVPLIAATSLPDGRLPQTNDAFLHFQRLISAGLNLQSGSLLPRWGPHLHAGYGYPLGNFYAPGWHILGGVLVWLGLPPVQVWLLAQTAGILLYPTGAYVFARLFSRPPAALLSAAVALYAPLRYYEVFVQGNVSQLITMGLIPWALWAFGRCLLRPRPGRIALAAGIFAVLMMMHHPTAALAAPLIGGYIVLAGAALLNREKPYRRILAALAAYGLALLLSAAYWLPALAESEYVSLDSAALQYRVEDGFIPPDELLGPVRGVDRGSFNQPFVLSAGRLHLALAAAGTLLALLLIHKTDRWQLAHLAGGLLVALGGLYLATYHSLWLWEAVPGARLILYPWRVLGLVAVALVPGTALLVERLPARLQSPIAGLATVAVFGTTLPLLYPLRPNAPDLAPVTPATSIEYELASGNMGGVATNEYLPQWVEERPELAPCLDCYLEWEWRVPVAEVSLPPGATVEGCPAHRQRGDCAEISTPNAFRLEWQQFYFPGWQARIDGQPVALAPTTPHGLLSTALPAGTHRVEIWYAGTPVQKNGTSISLLALALLGSLGLAGWKAGPVTKLPGRRSNRLAAAIIVGSLAFTAVNAAYIEPATDWFRVAGTPASPHRMETNAPVTFVDEQGTEQVRLLGYTLSTAQAEPGEWVIVDLYWQALVAQTRTWHTALDLFDPVQGKSWSHTRNLVPGGYSPSQWPTDRYIIDRHILRLGEDVPPYLGNLGVRILAADGTPGYSPANSQPYASLATLRIEGQGERGLPAAAQRVAVRFDEVVEVRAYQLSREPDAHLSLFWKVLQSPDSDYSVLVHFYDGDEFLGGADQPPIPAYPSRHWETGQYLRSEIRLAIPPGADSIAIGLYEQSTVRRLPVTESEGPGQIWDDTLRIPLDHN